MTNLVSVKLEMVFASLYRAILILFVLLFVVGCSGSGDNEYQKRASYDLRVTNRSNIDIYPVLFDPSRKVKDDFGVVAIGTSSTKGFGPFALSEHIIVIWEEGASDADYTADFYTKKILPLDPKIRRISFVFEKDKTWFIVGTDKNENEVVRLKGFRIERGTR